MINIGDKLTCPRCKENVEVTIDGIKHLSNVNGAHWQRYLLKELNDLKQFEQEQLNKLFYGN